MTTQTNALSAIKTKAGRVAFIKAQLATNDRWLVRGILAIYERQTADEQSSQATVEDNGIGFSGVDAFILSSFAKQIKEFKPNSRFTSPLSPKQMEMARKRMIKYAGQLNRIAEGSV